MRGRGAMVAVSVAVAVAVAGGIGVGAGAAVAQTRPAPDYFMEAVTALQAAQQVAEGCGTLSLDAAAVQSGTMAVMQRLAADGYDITRADAGMTLSDAALKAAQEDFAARHGLTPGAGAAAACRAGQAEMAEGSLIGTYLTAD